MSPIAFQTIEGRVAFVKEINFKQSLKLFLVLLRMYKKKFSLKTIIEPPLSLPANSEASAAETLP